MSQPLESLRSCQRWALVAAIVGVVICVAVSWDAPTKLWRAYLMAYMACWPVTLGAAALLAIGNLTGGAWAMTARPFYLAASQTILLAVILFIPIGLNLATIYPWADASSGEHALSPNKASYLAPMFFLWRAAGYLAVWLVIVGLLNYVSRPNLPPSSTPAMRRVGAFSLVLLAPTATFAAFDWGMSLEPEWYSSIYGAIVAAGGVLGAQALVICGLVVTRYTVGLAESGETVRSESHKIGAVIDLEGEGLAAQKSIDLGNLLLAFLMVFGYFTFSQFIIIWSGNLPSEITWYLRRLTGGWQWVAAAMVALQFAAFFKLLSRDQKRTPRRLAGIAVLLLAAHGLHTCWMIAPAFPETGAEWQLVNIAAIVGLAGAWVAAFCWHANRSTGLHRPLSASDDK